MKIKPGIAENIVYHNSPKEKRMFIGRNLELKKLNCMYQSNKLEVVVIYGITGGIPMYPEQFSPDLPMKENLLENLFDRNYRDQCQKSDRNESVIVVFYW